MKIGFTLLALGSGPLFLYVTFGPRDGNPVGLGLLFFFSFPAAMVCLVVGGVQHLLGRGVTSRIWEDPSEREDRGARVQPRAGLQALPGAGASRSSPRTRGTGAPDWPT